MRIASNNQPPVAPRNQQPQPPIKPPGDNKPEGPNPPPQDVSDKTSDMILESLVTSPDFTKNVMKRVSHGDEVTISVGDKTSVKISSTNNGPNIAERIKNNVQVGIRATTEEISGFMENDPLISFRTVAMGVKTQINNGLPTDLVDLGEKAFLPMVRVAALGFDGNKAYQTFRDKESRGLDKAIEGAHVLTDIVGVVGAFAPFIPVPFIKNNGTAMVAIGFAGDIVSCANRVSQWVRNRSENNSPNGMKHN